MLSFIIKEYPEVTFVGKVFRKYKINCIYGKSGIGKTISTIKALNEEGIEPILLDFDDNDSPKVNECNYVHVDGEGFIQAYKKKQNIVIPKEQVIIIDTWAMFTKSLDDCNMEKILDELKYKNTLIVIAHSKDLATKDDIADVPEELLNHFEGKMFLYYDKGSSRSSTKRLPAYILEIKKLRGYKGNRKIVNWMRD